MYSLCGRKEVFYSIYTATALHFSHAKLDTPASIKYFCWCISVFIVRERYIASLLSPSLCSASAMPSLFSSVKQVWMFYGGSIDAFIQERFRFKRLLMSVGFFFGLYQHILCTRYVMLWIGCDDFFFAYKVLSVDIYVLYFHYFIFLYCFSLKHLDIYIISAIRKNIITIIIAQLICEVWVCDGTVFIKLERTVTLHKLTTKAHHLLLFPSLSHTAFGIWKVRR